MTDKQTETPLKKLGIKHSRQTDRGSLIHKANEKQRKSNQEREEKMPKIDTPDALEEHEEHEDDYQTNSNR